VISRDLLLLPPKATFATMKTVTVAEAEKDFSSVLRIVRGGEEVEVTRRKKTVAKIVPVPSKRPKYDWASTWAKVDEIFGGKLAPGKPGSQIIIEGRR
jgi:prevent-host-death family protein